jgi:hypothetical protein
MKRKIDFIGIGAAKCGTTWLADCLDKHPQILLPNKKELYFFYKNHGHIFWRNIPSKYTKGLKWYLDQFSLAEKGKIRGEVATNYYRDTHAHKRIKKHFPHIKLIAVLRNPVDMLYSLFWFGKSTVSASVPDSFKKFSNQKEYLERGLFYKHLKKYYYIFDKRQIHTLLLDDIKTNPSKALSALYNFLEVDSDFIPKSADRKINPTMKVKNGILKKTLSQIYSNLSQFLPHNLQQKLVGKNIIYQIYKKYGLTRSSYPTIEKSLRYKLIEFYRDDIKKLEELINRDLSGWLE